MKWLISAVAVVVLAPVLLLGGLVAASSASSTDECFDTNTSGGCGTVGDPDAPRPFTGPDGYVDDPTSHGRITRRMLHTYQEVQRAFGSWEWGVTCWDPHAWNPSSDHPRGRACDFTVGAIGRRPTQTQRNSGWELAHWLEENANILSIDYIIWDGSIWSTARSHLGWRHYDGGGIYDPVSVTGGHQDHIHVNVTRGANVLAVEMALRVLTTRPPTV